MIVSDELHPRLCSVFTQALTGAGQVLTAMVGRRIVLGDPEIGVRLYTEVPFLCGGPEVPVVAIYLAIGGEIKGHVVFFFDQIGAGYLLEAMLGAAADYPYDSLARSALEEVGNVVGSSVLNCLSDATGMAVMPSPPLLTMDMAGAILGTIAADLAADSDQVLVIETCIAPAGTHQVQGYLLVLPDRASWDRIARELARRN